MRGIVIFVLVIFFLIFLAIAQTPGRFVAEASTPTACDRWVIAVIPIPADCSLTTQAPGCQPPEGWEPVSGVIYGEDGRSGVLLRRCMGR
jgi:hypothetical protein